MGKGVHGGFAKTHGADPRHNLTDNLPELKKHFKTTPEGYFGTEGSSTNVRRIASDDPLATAKKFFKIATKGAVETRHPKEGMTLCKMKDGSTVSIRVTSSSDGTPAVDIKIDKSVEGQIKTQKIHFVKKEE